jgi:phosphopentomutase
MLDSAEQAGLGVLGAVKLEERFANQRISECAHLEGNDEGTSQAIEPLKSSKGGIIFTSLGNFDTLCGHGNDPRGFADALEASDRWLPDLHAVMRPSDVVPPTADRGRHPTMPGTDHSREYMPLLVWGAAVECGVDLGTRGTFADSGAAVSILLGLALPQIGFGFAHQILI